jgi:fission process protein 1
MIAVIRPIPYQSELQLPYDDDDHAEGRPLTYASRFAVAMPNLSQVMRIARPLAYASEVGESFRPLFPLWLVRTFYGVSWAYVFVDTGVKTYEVREHGTEAMAYKACDLFAWHSIASMALPAFSIHSMVKYSGKAIQKVSETRALPERLKKFGPTAFGLGMIPFIIHPLDHLTDFVFDNSIRKLYAHKLVQSEFEKSQKH